MRRSDLVQKMTEFWLGFYPNERYLSNPEIYTEVRERMSDLLVLLERNGMLPPVKKNCPVTLRTEHTWEQENDLRNSR